VSLLVALALVAASPAPPERDVTYLLSVSIPLRDRERLYKFSFDTWGVEFLAVCHIPQGWVIKAGNGPTFDGVLNGGGSLGTNWLTKPMLNSLRNVALVSMFAPIRRVPVKDSGGNIIQPVTFKGRASISGYDNDRTLALTAVNVRLTRARSCPIFGTR
jgi:hypothetical protein